MFNMYKTYHVYNKDGNNKKEITATSMFEAANIYAVENIDREILLKIINSDYVQRVTVLDIHNNTFQEFNVVLKFADQYVDYYKGSKELFLVWTFSHHDLPKCEYIESVSPIEAAKKYYISNVSINYVKESTLTNWHISIDKPKSVHVASYSGLGKWIYDLRIITGVEKIKRNL